MKPLQVIRSSVLGYCKGVSRAVRIAEELAAAPDRRGDSAIYTYGPLIHNKTVLRKLAEKGVRILDNPEGAALRGARVIIRAHGVPPHVEAGLKKAGAIIEDATCPKVKAAQLLARKLCAKGRPAQIVFLAGDRHHAEVQGILGYAPDCVCVSNEAEAENAAKRYRPAAGAGGAPCEMPRAALLGQTTFPVSVYQKITAVLRAYFPQLDVKNTICSATAERQEALRKLCARADAVIITGGTESANTKALADIARSMEKRTFLIEHAGELKEIEAELAPFSRIGLAAGASTPLETVLEIEAALTGGIAGRPA
jgi:4-hydroxy-3-methylbut-2-enyl diphosphate reductase